MVLSRVDRRFAIIDLGSKSDKFIKPLLTMYFTHWQSRFGASLMIPPSSIQDIIKKSGYVQIQRLSHFNIRFPIDLSIGNVEIVYQRQIFQKNK